MKLINTWLPENLLSFPRIFAIFSSEVLNSTLNCCKTFFERFIPFFTFGHGELLC